MDVQPVRDQVVIEPLEDEKVSSGGIFIPNSDDESAKLGKVVAVGTGRVTDQGITIGMEVTEGDTVLYPKDGHQVNIEGTEYMVMKESSILAVINQG